MGFKMLVWALVCTMALLMQTVSGLTYIYSDLRHHKKVSLSKDQQMTILKQKALECLGKQLEPAPGPGVYCNVTWDNVMCWDYTEAGTEAVQSCPDYISGLKSVGVASRDCLKNGTWKVNPDFNNTEGWTNYTNCMGGPTPEPPPDYSHHFTRIQVMSEIGYGLSLASLIIAVLIMVASKRLHCKSNILHINLFCAFILRACITFIKTLLFVEDLGLEKDVIRHPGGRIDFIKDGTHWECKLIVTILVYALSASLMWILMEGMYLHMLVYRTLFTERHGTRIYVLVGWFSPFLYLIPWVIVRAEFDNEFCWNTNERDYYIWIIKGPLTVSVVMNFIFFIRIVRVLCVRANVTRHIKSDAHHLRKTAKFVLVLIPLFGVIYIAFAVYPVSISLEADIVYLYGEMFYNSFQGFFLALLFCFLNEEVHNEIRRFWYRRRPRGFSTRSILMSSWRKNSRNSRADVVTRTGNVTEHNLLNCKTDAVGNNSCKINKKCQEHVTWKSSKRDRDGSNGSNNGSTSWKSEDCANVVVVSNVSDSSPTHAL